MPTDISDGRITTEGIARVSDETVERLARHKTKPRTIVLPRRGDITKRALIRDDQDGWLCGSGCLKIEVHESEVLPEYLYYYMSLHSVGRWLEQHAVGSTMLNLSAGTVNLMPVRYPGMKVQERIAGVLTAYDDLIENNRRRMALLEESARLLYREWFVRLCFPGHERTRTSDGRPLGWDRLPLESALVLQRGFDLPSQDREDGEVPIYGSTGINGYHNTARVTGPGVVTGRSGTLGEVRYVREDFWPLNTALWVKEFRRVTPLFALFLLRSLDLKQFNGGSSVPTLDRKSVHKIEVLVPPSELVAMFDEQVTPLFDQLTNLTLQNQKLRTARDHLLPRLMSGELAV